jgi:hypothetical protein
MMVRRPANRRSCVVKLRSCLALTWALSLGGCSEGLVCTADVRPAIIVEIRDADTALPVAAEAMGHVQDGAFVDSLRAYGADGTVLVSRAAADEREGTYTVEVVHEGYQPWQQTAVRVGRNACHVETVTLQAGLERSS